MRFFGPASIKVIRTVNIEIQPLVELLVAKIAAELKAVISDYFSKAVRNLVSVALLRQLTFKVVPDRKSAGNINVRDAFAAGPEIWVNSQRIGRVGDRVRIR